MLFPDMAIKSMNNKYFLTKSHENLLLKKSCTRADEKATFKKIRYYASMLA